MSGGPGIVVGALTWNTFHGLDKPPDPGLITWRSRLLRVTEVLRRSRWAALAVANMHLIVHDSAKSGRKAAPVAE